MADSEKPYREKRVLKRLYYGEDMPQQEIAEKFGVSIQTISRWMNNHSINPGIESSQFNRKEKATFLTDSRGYERFDAYDQTRQKKEYVKVHRLLAVAYYGMGALDGKHVHHKNKIPWDNRPDNIEVVDPIEHIRSHAIERELGHDADGRFE